MILSLGIICRMMLLICWNNVLLNLRPVSVTSAIGCSLTMILLSFPNFSNNGRISSAVFILHLVPSEFIKSVHESQIPILRSIKSKSAVLSKLKSFIKVAKQGLQWNVKSVMPVWFVWKVLCAGLSISSSDNGMYFEFGFQIDCPMVYMVSKEPEAYSM